MDLPFTISCGNFLHKKKSKNCFFFKGFTAGNFGIFLKFFVDFPIIFFSDFFSKDLLHKIFEISSKVFKAEKFEIVFKGFTVKKFEIFSQKILQNKIWKIALSKLIGGW